MGTVTVKKISCCYCSGFQLSLPAAFTCFEVGREWRRHKLQGNVQTTASVSLSVCLSVVKARAQVQGRSERQTK